MGLFGNLFKAPDKQVDFLMKADLAYSKAFQTKNAAGLDTFFTRTCLTKLLERLRLSEKVYAGIDRYKHVEWKKIDENDDTTTYMKNVTYDNVKISKGISAAVGESYCERWTLVRDKGVTKVSEIRRVA